MRRAVDGMGKTRETERVLPGDDWRSNRLTTVVSEEQTKRATVKRVLVRCRGHGCETRAATSRGESRASGCLVSALLDPRASLPISSRALTFASQT